MGLWDMAATQLTAMVGLKVLQIDYKAATIMI